MNEQTSDEMRQKVKLLYDLFASTVIALKMDGPTIMIAATMLAGGLILVGDPTPEEIKKRLDVVIRRLRTYPGIVEHLES